MYPARILDVPWTYLPCSYDVPPHYFVFTKRITRVIIVLYNPSATMKAILIYELWIVHCQFSIFLIVNCALSIAFVFASIYASASSLEATLLLPSCYPLTCLYLESSFFASFMHNDSIFICVLLQTAFFVPSSRIFHKKQISAKKIWL